MARFPYLRCLDSISHLKFVGYTTSEVQTHILSSLSPRIYQLLPSFVKVLSSLKLALSIPVILLLFEWSVSLILILQREDQLSEQLIVLDLLWDQLHRCTRRLWLLHKLRHKDFSIADFTEAGCLRLLLSFRLHHIFSLVEAIEPWKVAFVNEC
jgi:hypothetical protein